MEMTPLLTRLAVLLTTLSLAAAAPPSVSSQQEVKKTTEEKTLKCAGAEVEIAGVSFRCDPALFVEVWGGLVPEKPLLSKDDKPDYVSPERVLIILYGPDAAKDNRTFFGLPVISVARLDGFARAHALDPAHAAALGRRAAEIKSLLARRPKSFKGEIPLMPYVEGAQDFHARLNYFRFRNGRGVAFVAHYSIEPTVTTGRGLAYIFEGVTDDGLHYVSAMFPVEAPDGAAPHGPNFREMNTPASESEYANYVRRTKRRLARLSPGKFQPDLARLNRLLSTINVRRRG